MTVYAIRDQAERRRDAIIHYDPKKYTVDKLGIVAFTLTEVGPVQE